jgi:hypothetical protein
VLLVLLVSASKPVQLVRDYEEHRLGMSSGVYALPSAPAPADAHLADYLEGFRTFLLENRQEFMYRSAFVLGLAALLGLAIGILLPRLTMIVGTSLVGVVASAAGIGVLLSTRWPAGLAWVSGNVPWTFGAAGLLLASAMLFQARRRRPVVAAPAAAPATA